MVKIAICDDDAQAVARQEAIVRQSLQKAGIQCALTTYTQSGNLLADLRDDGFFYDLILLDIEMPGLDGMALARQAQTFLRHVRIVFVTSHTEYAIDAFELSIFRYVPKDSLETKLAAAVTDAAKLVELETGQSYVIATASRLEKIPYRDIAYIERDGKNARVVFSGGDAKVRKSLQQVFEELGSPEFLFIDRGCIANLLQIMKIEGGVAVLKDGTRLPISRSHLQEVKRQINLFWGAHI